MTSRTTGTGTGRVWAEVDLDAVAHNAGVLAAAAAPARLCAVVKANGYGHGAPEVAAAALTGGASWLAVALAEEGIVLRSAGIKAPVLVLSEVPAGKAAAALDHDLTLTVYTAAGIDALLALDRSAPVHLKVDTGMHRVGCPPDEALALAPRIRPPLVLEGLWTHLAGSEEGSLDEFTGAQLESFERVRAELAAAGIAPPLVHAANTGGALFHPASRYDLVRCGIGIYGYPPVPGYPVDLRPALSLRAEVTHVKTVRAGEGISYNLRYRPSEDTVVATVPIGYADGVPRRLAEVGGEVLVGGHRRPIAGAVTMDQLMVDCGPEAEVIVGDEVVLIGWQGESAISADDWAAALGTISYEVLCAIGPRVPRRYR